MLCPNSLVAGKFHLTKEEQNLIFLVASQINSSDEDFKTYKVYIGFRKSY
ncbi:replication initiation protein [Francisella noatunensis]|uniref:Replication initiation protein n=1 Tax=Francisella noatunensis TaxID=657445 RepID=A0A9Q2KVA3_9GAMM|nr:replication initiation protein [Francisella noatunensis]MBK2033986.1 replication initiation protein [Francisella noatunensis]MBK2048821.1 replication initiation protein [Francisella noatunensis]MBK2050775.1 replication initiation protein [Francisella noatunensis]MBK2052240.1 replication initiation protein [Francisella noatunensis]